MDEVIGTPRTSAWAGEEREVTVMFTDIRGFTSFSESMPPTKVIEILNRYLSGMSDAILDHGGTLCAFLGDGILAVFGSPVHQDDHADRALAAGSSCSRAASGVQRVDGRRRATGTASTWAWASTAASAWPETSDPRRRLEYTVIGDVVNTASRIEGISKDTPHLVFISDATVQLLQEQVPDLVFVDEMEVRGRQAKVKLWSLPLGVKTTP